MTDTAPKHNPQASAATPPQRGRPRDPERVERVLAAAGQLFLEQGFERTTMDQVARQAGVAKMTVYSYFPTKEALFEAAVARGTHRAMHAELPVLDPMQPREVLTRFGKGFMTLMRHPQLARMQAMMFNLGEAQAPLREAYYRQGPERLAQTLTEYFQQTDRAGTLRVPQPRIAAEQFLAMFVHIGQLRIWLGMTPPTPQEDAALLKANVALFLKGYAP